jgi:alpha-D-ribose 1-methylphosphonate 5-triphosphate synthase subunit PhnG
LEVVVLVDPVVESPGYGRREWLSVLAKAQPGEVAAAWEALEARPGYTALRAPELGLVLVRGRMGGLGDAFNLGEMTVTRAAVRLESGETGLAYVAGRERRHAEIAAAVDAMMQSETLRQRVEEPVVGRLRRAQEARRTLAARKAAATTVDFFTLVNGRGGA